MEGWVGCNLRCYTRVKSDGKGRPAPAGHCPQLIVLHPSFCHPPDLSVSHICERKSVPAEFSRKDKNVKLWWVGLNYISCVSCFKLFSCWDPITVANFPAVFVHICIFDICNDKHKNQNMQLRVSWVGQLNRSWWLLANRYGRLAGSRTL